MSAPASTSERANHSLPADSEPTVDHERNRIDRRKLIVGLCIITVLVFYVRCSWTYGKDLDPAQNRGDFQNLQVDAFLAGQLNLRIVPPDGLLLLEDPYDASSNVNFRAAGLHDLSLYDGNIYAYFGPAPVLLLFLPYQLLRVGDLSTTLACLIFCSGGFLAAVGVFRNVTRRFLRPLSIAEESIAVLALGFAAPMGWLISIGRGYEVAIAGGYFMVFTGLYALSRGLFTDARRRSVWLALASALLVGSVGARPSLFWVAGFLGFAMYYLWSTSLPNGRLNFAAIVLPSLTVAGLLAWYNAARFGSPTEFGTSYMLLGENVRLARSHEIGFLRTGLFEYLLAPARSTDAFPWIALRPTAQPTPTELNYLREPVAGLLLTFPAAVLGVVSFAFQRWERFRQLRWLSVFIALTAAIALLIVATFSFVLHGATMRYQLDYAPLLLMASTLGWFMFSQQWEPNARPRLALGVLAIGVVAWSTLFSIAITAYPCAGTGSC